MLKSTDKGFQVQKKENCTNYNWAKNPAQRCAIACSESLAKPVNAYIRYKKCCLDEGTPCKHFNCGVQLIS